MEQTCESAMTMGFAHSVGLNYNKEKRCVLIRIYRTVIKQEKSS